MSKKIGIYVHLPFCKSKCAYCDFYSQKSDLQNPDTEAQMTLYQKALLAHFKTSSMSARGLTVDTIYFGGGTPTFYGATRIDGLLRGIRKSFRVSRDAEITVEGNPDSVQMKEIQALRRCGVNRISLGMQSAHQNELTAVGRPHTPEDTRIAVSVLKSAQIKNISLDLIYGLPHQTFDSWQSTLEEAIALEPEHLSCYGLKVEEGTPLYERVAKGELLPDEDVQADLYLWTVERLKKAGYCQYEISNFAQKNKLSQHNMGYWLGKPYLSFGASASSDFGGYRYTFLDDTEGYSQAVLEGKGNLFSSNDLVSEGERAQEYIFLRLHTSEGLNGRNYEKTLGLDFTPLENFFLKFQKEGWAEQLTPSHWVLTPQGFLRSNLLIGTLLEAQESSAQATLHPITVKQLGTTLKKENAKTHLTATIKKEEKTDDKENDKEHNKEKTGIILQEGEDGQLFF